MRRLLLLIPVIWFLGLLSLPAIAYVAGKRQPLLENREKTAFPPINRSSLQSAEVFKRIDSAVLERLPFRDDAVELRSRVALRAFGVSPSAEVVPGRGGWLYMWRDFRPCLPIGGPVGDPADAVEIIARTIGASGRRAGVLVAGSKTATQPEHLRTDADRQLARCVAEKEERVHERLRSTPGGIDITAELEREHAAGRDTFLKKDSHWEGNAQLAFVRAMLDAARPGLAEEAGVEQVTKPIEREADLTRLVGLPEQQDTLPPIARKRVAYPNARPGETFLLGDSQLRLALTDQLTGRPPISDAALPSPYYCDRGGFPTPACDAQLVASRILLVEWVARDMQDIVGICAQFPRLLIGDVRKRVDATPAPLIDVATGKRAPTRLQLGAAPVSVRFLPNRDVAKSLRLLVIPVERLGTPQPGGPENVEVTQRPADGGNGAPCTTPEANAGDMIVLPLPAGIPASQRGLELSAPPGTVLGKPESLLLDDATVERGMKDALVR